MIKVHEPNVHNSTCTLCLKEDDSLPLQFVNDGARTGGMSITLCTACRARLQAVLRDKANNTLKEEY